MYQKLLDHSPDLKRLRDDGYELEIRGSFALVHHIPYLNSRREICFGTLVSGLALAGERTLPPDTHVIRFTGEHPCETNGNKITAIILQSVEENLGNDIITQHSFSNKPANGYQNYYDKFVSYINLISSYAISMNPEVTAKTYFVYDTEGDSIFRYRDTNSSKAAISNISDILKVHNIGIIGLGGTGSYILDMVAKTPVCQINLYDGDDFVQHNAFRAPGAASIEELKYCSKKVDYFQKKYSLMHMNIVAHKEYLSEENIHCLEGLSFVFLCIDNGPARKLIIDYLKAKQIPFIDVGIGLHVFEDALLGQVRTTIGLPGEYDQIACHLDFSENEDDNEAIYKTNIQVAEINALNACFAVIQWKKYCGFYQDVSCYKNMTYSINDGELINL